MIAIDLHLGSPLGAVQADPVQIEQILLNLGSNAADSMPEGGRLILEPAMLAWTRNFAAITRGRFPAITSGFGFRIPVTALTRKRCSTFSSRSSPPRKSVKGPV